MGGVGGREGGRVDVEVEFKWGGQGDAGLTLEGTKAGDTKSAAVWRMTVWMFV